jgi:dimethylhistidine N-methyltransferase
MHKQDPELDLPQFNVHDLGWNKTSFIEAMLDGLSRPQKAIPCAFLYDRRGSRYFEQICGLPEYYPYRTEIRILQSHAPEIAELIGADAVLYELGSGSSVKTPILLDKIDGLYAYVPIDVSRDALIAASAELSAAYPNLRVEAICGDYAKPSMLPDIESRGRPVAFFPGSTIGNLNHREAIALLKQWRARLGSSGLMIVGVDLKKDPGLIELAYNDNQGVTEAFIKNVLARANKEANAGFDLDAFRYEAFWDEDRGCMRMNLVSRRDQEVSLAGRDFYFARDEELHIEDSHKYTCEEFAEIATAGGFSVAKVFADPRKLFSVQILTACS